MWLPHCSPGLPRRRTAARAALCFAACALVLVGWVVPAQASPATSDRARDLGSSSSAEGLETGRPTAPGSSPAAIDPSLGRRSVQPLDRSLLIPTESVLPQIRLGGNLVLVDVREAEGSPRARLPGALWIPLYSVKTKGYLKERAVVLVGEGTDAARLAAEAQRLRETGFRSASVLAGGVRRWGLSGGPFEGNRGAGEASSRIAPAAFYAALADETAVAIDVSPDAGGPEWVPGAAHLPAGEGTGAFVSRVADLVASRRREGAEPGAFVTLLLFDSDGRSCEAAERALARDLLARDPGLVAFCLEGGTGAYRRFLTEQTAFLRGPVREQGERCLSCPPRP